MNKIIEYFNIVFVILWSMFMFTLGITQSVLMSQYDQFKKLENGCEELWKSLGNASFANILEFVLLLIACMFIFALEQKKIDKFMQKIKKYFGYYLFHFLAMQSFITYIFIASLYHKTSDFCFDFWTRNAPELWTLVIIEYFNLWIVVAVSIICICKCVIWLFSPVPPSNSTVQLTANTSADKKNDVTDIPV